MKWMLLSINKLFHVCCVCAHVHILLTLHFALSRFMCGQFSCLQIGRSKRKSFWNDREETVLEYPIGTGSNSKKGEAPSFSRMWDKQQVSHQMSTLLMPHLSTCEQSVQLPPSPSLVPSKHHFTQAMSLPLAQSPTTTNTTIPCTRFHANSAAQIFCHNSCSFTWYWRCHCVINSHILQFHMSVCVWFIHSLVCPWMPFYLKFLWRTLFSLSIIMYGEGQCVESLGSICIIRYILYIHCYLALEVIQYCVTCCGDQSSWVYNWI